MFFSKNEEEIMTALLQAVNNDVDKRYIIEYANGDIFEVSFDTCYESDNGLDEFDEMYEEYFACSMKIDRVISNCSNRYKQGELIEINYREFPLKIANVKGEII